MHPTEIPEDQTNETSEDCKCEGPGYLDKFWESARGGCAIGLLLWASAHLPFVDNKEAITTLKKFLDDATHADKEIFLPVLAAWVGSMGYAGVRWVDWAARTVMRPALGVCVDFCTTAAGVFVPLTLPLWSLESLLPSVVLTVAGALMPALAGAAFYGARWLSEQLTQEALPKWLSERLIAASRGGFLALVAWQVCLYGWHVVKAATNGV